MTTETAQVDAPQTTVAVAAVSDALPDRPPISAPAKLQGHELLASERKRSAQQPALGLAGIVLVLPVAVLLGIALEVAAAWSLIVWVGKDIRGNDIMPGREHRAEPPSDGQLAAGEDGSRAVAGQ